jgi:hypothetical protein
VHSDDAPPLYRTIINTLTGAACSELMAHFAGVKSRIYSTNGEDLRIPTLDERNEDDEHARGQALSDHMTAASGFTVELTPYRNAQILDGIRHTLYEEMPGWCEVADQADALTNTPAYILGAGINYNQPMSAQMYMEYRLANIENINSAEVKLGATMLQLPEEVVRASLLEQAQKRKAAMLDQKPMVLAELNSMTDAFDIDAFTGLSIILQCRIGTSINDKLAKQYTQLLPRAIRDITLIARLHALKAISDQVTDWLRANDTELQEAMIKRRAA